jgi:uncharacterized repeat protein (TIGR01451 family)
VHEMTRRDAMKRALKAGAYVAPTIAAATVPIGVAAATPAATADLAVTKTVDIAAPVVGTNVTFTLMVRNNGPAAATGVTANDPLPAGLTFVSASPTVGTYNSATGVWTIGTLAAGAVATLTLAATAAGPAGTARTNTATVASAITDPALSNNTASATVTPQAAPTADIALSKTVDDATPIVGANVTFTVTARNNGPSAATGVAVNDALPAGLTFVSATPSQGTYTSGTGAWNIGALALNQQVTLAIVAAATGPVGTARTNTAARTASTPADPNATNDSASATVTPQVAPTADIAVTKTVDTASPVVGANVTFTVTAQNNGPNAATGVVVTDLLPTGLAFVSASPSQGTYNSTTGAWAIGPLAVSQQVTLTIVATAAGPAGTTRTNTATRTASSPADPNAANDSASAAVTPVVPTADIEVTKILATEAPGVGDNITFQLAVTNHGPNVATGVVVSDPVPPTLSNPQGLPPDQGMYDVNTGIWTIGTLQVGQAVTLAITGTIVGSMTNTATRTASSPTDPNPANDSASVTVTVPVPL